MEFLNHFEIKKLAEEAKSYIMSTEEFSRAVLLGERHFVYSYDENDFNTYKYKLIGLHKADINLKCDYNNYWVVDSIDFYCDILFLPRHDYNYDIDIKYIYHIISCELLSTITKYEFNILNSMFVNLLNNSEIELNCDISRLPILSMINCELTTLNYDFVMSKLDKVAKSGIKVTKFNLDAHINTSLRDFSEILLIFYNLSNILLDSDRELYFRVELLSKDLDMNLYYHLNELYNKLLLNKIIHSYSYLVLDVLGFDADSLFTDENIFVLRKLKTYFRTIYVNGRLVR